MIFAVIPSAGRGERLGSKTPKQFLKIKDIPLIIYTIMRFERHPKIQGIVISSSEERIEFVKELVKHYGLKKVYRVVKGGRTRQESVYNGVKACPEETKFILVHDAVRPFVSYELIDRIIDGLKEWDAVVPGIPVRDALSRVEKNFILENVDRTGLFQIQTPQGAGAEVLKKCLELAQKQNLVFPDESSLLLHYGYRVLLVEGSFINYKITYPEDFVLAEKLIDCKIEEL